jgi:hypothetical protein
VGERACEIIKLDIDEEHSLEQDEEVREIENECGVIKLSSS